MAEGTRWSKVKAEFVEREDTETFVMTMLNLTLGRIYTVVVATPKEKGQVVLGTQDILGAMRAANAFVAQAAKAPLPDGIRAVGDDEPDSKKGLN